MAKVFLSLPLGGRRYVTYRAGQVALVLLLVAMTGCRSNPSGEVAEHTLAGNESLPWERIKRFYEPHRRGLKDIPYQGYVVLLGTATSGEEGLTNIRAVDAFPDDSKVALAEAFAARVSMREGQGRINHEGDTSVHVIFYELEDDTDVAMVYAGPVPGSRTWFQRGGELLFIAHY